MSVEEILDADEDAPLLTWVGAAARRAADAAHGSGLEEDGLEEGDALETGRIDAVEADRDGLHDADTGALLVPPPNTETLAQWLSVADAAARYGHTALSPSERQSWTLRRDWDLSWSRTADIMGITISSIRSYIARAEDKLEEAKNTVAAIHGPLVKIHEESLGGSSREIELEPGEIEEIRTDGPLLVRITAL